MPIKSREATVPFWSTNNTRDVTRVPTWSSKKPARKTGPWSCHIATNQNKAMHSDTIRAGRYSSFFQEIRCQGLNRKYKMPMPPKATAGSPFTSKAKAKPRYSNHRNFFFACSPSRRRPAKPRALPVSVNTNNTSGMERVAAKIKMGLEAEIKAAVPAILRSPNTIFPRR